jgi:anti-anti-sigma factor
MLATFQFTCDAPVARLRVSGDLDLSSGALLTDVFDCLEFRGCLLIEMDLSAIGFVDASSLSLLHHEQCRLRESGGDLQVVAASAPFLLVARLAEYDTLEPAPTSPPHLTVLRTRRHLHAHRD